MSPSRWRKALWLIAAATIILSVPTLHPILADQQSPITNALDVQLFVGSRLLVASDQNTIQRVLLQGNLTAANYTQPAQYPTNDFELTSSNPGTYDLRVLFDWKVNYIVNLYVQSNQSAITYSTPEYLPSGGQPKPNPIPNALAPNQSATTNSTTYYLSGGAFELDLEATFIRRSSANLTPLSWKSGALTASFTDWIGNFEQAFPLWVKLVYLILGIQFLAVGGSWIRRESERKKSTGHSLDAGNKVFLWLDIVYKFLSTSFLVIIAIMGGEFLVLFVLRFMFLVSLDLLSLWDLFVVGFAGGIVVMTYLVRFTLEKGFDLNPLEEV